MKINILLMRPVISQIEKKIHAITGKLSEQERLLPGSRELLSQSHILLSDLHDLKLSLAQTHEMQTSVSSLDLHEELRRLKREAHSAERKLKKIILNDIRFGKITAESRNVSKVAA